MDLKARIREFVKQSFFYTGALGDDESLLDRGIIDSTGVLEVVGFLESEFGITVADEEMLPDNLDSIPRTGGLRRQEARRPAGGRGVHPVGLARVAPEGYPPPVERVAREPVCCPLPTGRPSVRLDVPVYTPGPGYNASDGLDRRGAPRVAPPGPLRALGVRRRGDARKAAGTEAAHAAARGPLHRRGGRVRSSRGGPSRAGPGRAAPQGRGGRRLGRRGQRRRGGPLRPGARARTRPRAPHARARQLGGRAAARPRAGEASGSRRGSRTWAPRSRPSAATAGRSRPSARSSPSTATAGAASSRCPPCSTAIGSTSRSSPSSRRTGEPRSSRHGGRARTVQLVAATNFKQRVRKMMEYYHADRLALRGGRHAEPARVRPGVLREAGRRRGRLQAHRAPLQDPGLRSSPSTSACPRRSAPPAHHRHLLAPADAGGVLLRAAATARWISASGPRTTACPPRRWRPARRAHGGAGRARLPRHRGQAAGHAATSTRRPSLAWSRSESV